MSTGDTITRTVDPPMPRSADRAAGGDRLQRWAVAGTVTSLLLLAGLRLLFLDGLVRLATIDGPSMAPALCGASYAVDCHDCGFPFRCDAEHVPADRLAACPNCGYARNDLDDARLLPPERVVIDRWRLSMRAPKRGEVVACDLPRNGEIAVKRVASVPPPAFAIRSGDVYASGMIIRKTLAEFHAVRLLVHDNGYQPQKTPGLPPRWSGVGDETKWQARGSRFERPAQQVAGETDWLEYQHWPCTADSRLRGTATAIRDNDSYNQGETRRPLNAASDVILSCRVQAAGEGEVVLAATDGEQQFAITIEPRRQVVVRSGGQTLQTMPLKLNFARRGIDLEFGLYDQQLLLAIQGRTIVRLPYERPVDSKAAALHPLAIGVHGLAAEVTWLRVWRDIYYLDAQGLDRPWEAPQGTGSDQYALLGDNPPVSIDSRQWEPPLVSARAIRGLVYRPFWVARSPTP